jgi:hypothetical protein
MLFQRKTVSALLFCLALAFVPPVFAQGKGLKKIRVGVPSVSMGNIIIFVTREARLFEKYGLDAEEFADASFVEELDKSGFIKKLYER